MINPELINQTALIAEIESLETAYVQQVVKSISTPIFIDLCTRDIETADEERKKELEKILETHKTNMKTSEESINTLNQLIPQVRSYLI